MSDSASPRWPWSFRRSDRRGGLAIIVLAVASVLVPILVIDLLAITLRSLPNAGTLPSPRAPIGTQITEVFDASGAKISTFQQFETNLPVRPEDIPLVLKQAVIASEDQRFYDHQGVDLRGLLRAMWADFNGGQYRQGASTIDEQYVRLLYGNDKRSISRKAREAILAGRVDIHLSKDEILFGYLSRVYLGGGAYGVGAAAQSYFRKPVHDLTLSEAALLTSILPAPSRYDPRTDPKGADARRLDVLVKMRQQGYISASEEADASAQTVTLTTADIAAGAQVTLVYPDQPPPSRYPWFVDYVRRYLIARFGPDVAARGGLRVETSLDPALQATAESTVAASLDGTQAPLDMAMVVVNPKTGLVRAMVGGRDFTQSQVNLALGSCPPVTGPQSGDTPICIGGGGSGRQPGSSFKPFTLATAFEQGLDATKMYSGPSSYTFPAAGCRGPGCTVHNVESGGYGSIDLRHATAYSVNTVFAQLIQDVGVAKTADLAHRLGVTMINPDGKGPNGQTYGPGLTLGTADVSPLDMAAAYSVFAARGLQFPASPIVRVIAADGTVLEDNTARQGQRVLPATVADQVNDVLKDVVGYGTGVAAAIGRPNGTAGKTGTTEAFSDAWFVGYTPTLAASVWMGYRDGRRPLVNIKGLPQVFGGTIPAQTWHDFMTSALASTPEVDFTPPPGAAPPTTVVPPTLYQPSGGPATTPPTLRPFPPPSVSVPATGWPNTTLTAPGVGVLPTATTTPP